MGKKMGSGIDAVVVSGVYAGIIVARYCLPPPNIKTTPTPHTICGMCQQTGNIFSSC